MNFTLADLRGFNAMPLRDRNRFLAACETIEKHEAANNEVAQNGLLRSEDTDRRPTLERIRADNPKRRSKPRGEGTTVGEAATHVVELQTLLGGAVQTDDCDAK